MAGRLAPRVRPLPPPSDSSLIRPEIVPGAKPLEFPPFTSKPVRVGIRGTSKDSALARRHPLEARLGLRFRDRSLLDEALVHSSYVNERPDVSPVSNERMEFLGDAVLGLIVADELYARFDSYDEGRLTELRTHLVRRDTLAEAARRLQLGETLLLGKGEETGGGRARPSNLACAYEAVVGAIFLDRGLPAARRFIVNSLGPEFGLIESQSLPSDPKSALQEASQSRFQAAPLYRLLKSEGPDHARRFTIEVSVAGRSLGVGHGSSKQQAEKEAAQRALEQIRAEGGESGQQDLKCT